MLSVLSSGFRFNDSNYDYDNSNTDSSSRLSYLLSSVNHAHMAKNKSFNGALVAKATTIQ
jgi:hypothetical protein